MRKRRFKKWRDSRKKNAKDVERATVSTNYSTQLFASKDSTKHSRNTSSGTTSTSAVDVGENTIEVSKQRNPENEGKVRRYTDGWLRQTKEQMEKHKKLAPTHHQTLYDETDPEILDSFLDILETDRAQLALKGLFQDKLPGLEEVKHYVDKGKNSLLLNDIEIALKNDEAAPFSRSKLMVVGAGRAGKTSTIKRLLGQDFDYEEPSTRGCSLKVSSSTHVQKDNTWREAGKSIDHVVSHLRGAIGKPKHQRCHEVEPVSEDNESNEMLDLSYSTLFDYGMRYITSMNEDDRQVRHDFDLGFTIWDFAGQSIFYSLHHLFLTDFGCYLVVFNAKRVLLDDKNSMAAEIDYLVFWLNSKKLHAPRAPVFIVGTNCADFEPADIREVNKRIEECVLKDFEFRERRFMGTEEVFGDEISASFFPVDNATGLGIDILRMAIVDVVSQEEYINAEVKISYIRALDVLSKCSEKFLHIDDAKKLMASRGIAEDDFQPAMLFLTERGFITYFEKIESCSNYLVIDPQWLINGITKIIYDEIFHTQPKFNPELNVAFRVYTRTGVITDELMTDIWKHKGYSARMQSFFKEVMVLTSLMCNYKFDNVDSYLIPRFPDIMGVKGKTPPSPEYSGPYFVIDFSGDYETRKNIVRYLPFGMFEKLVCQFVQHSSHFEDNMEPELKNHVARLSLGTDVVFEMQIAENFEGEKLWILVKTYKGTSFLAVRELIKQLYSIIQAVTSTYFHKHTDDFPGLSCRLLLPATEKANHQLASYQMVAKKRADNSTKKFRPSRKSPITISPDEYNHWFQDSEKLNEDSIKNNLVNPQVLNSEETLAATSPYACFRSLTASATYHCFLSYRHSDSLDVVGKLYLQLQNLGYKCWYDQQFKGPFGVTVAAMQHGVQNSMVYVLILSKDVFKSEFVAMEVETAVRAKKQIMFLSHPDTNSIGYVEFAHYINTAPDVVKPLFNSVESLQIRRRYHEEVGFLKEMERRLEMVRQY
eukprot:snap_masked-scaffold_14-processed-gene-9.21-mRNA-1 protein AED:1.00 eAED:1.00 QI:0/-1/0/0/-1/1/1/0/988